MIERCHRAGLNVLLPSVMVNQSISFRSSRFPGHVAANDAFDPLAYVVRRAHEREMQVEAWCCVYYEGTRKDATTPLHPEWLVRSMSGHPFGQDFLSPSIPAVNSYLLSILADLLAYDVDGIHLDYIRYPGTAFDYSQAARTAFEASVGFDPLDFLDHAERIVDPDDEPYPIRVLNPREHADKAWETTSIERTLDQAGLGYTFVSESPENIARLRTPGLLIVSSYYDVPTDMVDALADFVARGGDLIWTDVPASALAKSPELRRLLGLRGATWKGERRIALAPVDSHPLGDALSCGSFFTTSSYDPQPDTGIVAARLADGSPAVVINDRGGKVLALGFHLMKSTSPVVPALAKSIVTWLKTEAGVSTADPLAAKRAAWVAWRAERVTELVRQVHAAAQHRVPAVAISSSGGPSPSEFYSCYRDARRWLAEGLNDHVFPMNYTEDPVALVEMLEVQTASAPPHKFGSIFPGLQTYKRVNNDGETTVEPLDAKIVERQLQVVREHGYGGYALFAYNTLSDEALEVVRRVNGVRLQSNK
jgi:uncharacterized lipoprotein YddW (UPF0748 family)